MSLNAGRGRHGIQADPVLDKQFKMEHYNKQTNAFYQEMQEARRTLPIFKENDKISQHIEYTRDSQVTVISGETGCGKTTQVPQFILDDYIIRGQGSRCRVVCTQPRRISAISVAHRVAVERAERVGGDNSTVGYQIRMEVERPRDKGSILFCTPGIVLKWLESDPELATISHLILDEIHERDIHSEFLLTIVKDILHKRPDLKLILMSATLNAEKFSQYYNNCPIFKIPGFLFPVQDHYLEDIVEMTSYRPARTFRGRGGYHQREFANWLDRTGYSPQTKSTLTSLYNDQMIDLDLIASLIRVLCFKEEGAILVFLPGWDQITRLHEKLEAQYMFQSESYRILALHGGMMTTKEQQEVFITAPPGVRKIVLSTNVAETSITIDDVVYVIDCGKSKMSKYDPRKNIVTLEDQWNSLANSKQRRGRAGRVKPGHCYHMYTRHQETKLVDQHKPEILRVRLEDLCLKIKLLNRGRIMAFFDIAMETPPPNAIERSIRHLRNLNALDSNEELTPLGYQLARLPVDPHLSKMMLFAAIFGCLDPILTIAATLDYRTKTPFINPVDKRQRPKADEMKRKIADGSCSDHLMFHNAYKGWKKAKHRGDSFEYLDKNYLSIDTFKEVKKGREHFAKVLNDMGFIKTDSPSDPDANVNSKNLKLVRGIICAGLYPNVGTIKTSRMVPGLGHQYYKIEIGEEEVELHLKSVNHQQMMPYGYVVYFQKMKTKEVYLFDSTGISLNPLIYFGGDFQLSSPDAYRNINVNIDNSISFKMSMATARELEALRQDLWEILEKKFEDPCMTDWSDADSEGYVLKRVVDRITKDDTVAIL